MLRFKFVIIYDLGEDKEHYIEEFNFRKGYYQGMKRVFDGMNWSQEMGDLDINTEYSQSCITHINSTNRYIGKLRRKQ